MNTKSSQIQIRVSDAEKASIKKQASAAGMDMSAWIMTQLFPPSQKRFLALINNLKTTNDKKLVLAKLNDLLHKLGKNELACATKTAAKDSLGSYLDNYIAAMVEQALVQKGLPIPNWLSDIPILKEPVFGSDLLSLRLYLLSHSPPAFRKRNIFIDSSIGNRI